MWEILYQNHGAFSAHYCVHNHDIIKVYAVFNYCPLCKEDIPDHIDTQIKLLNAMTGADPDYIDFYYPAIEEWIYFSVMENRFIHIEARALTVFQHEKIKELFNNHGFIVE